MTFKELKNLYQDYIQTQNNLNNLNSNIDWTLKEIKNKREEFVKKLNEIRTKFTERKSIFEFKLKDFAHILQINSKEAGVEIKITPERKTITYEDNDFYATSDITEDYLIWRFRFPKDNRAKDCEFFQCRANIDYLLGHIDCDFSNLLFEKVPYKEIIVKTIFDLVEKSFKDLALEKQNKIKKSNNLLTERYKQLSDEAYIKKELNRLENEIDKNNTEIENLNNVNNIEI